MGKALVTSVTTTHLFAKKENLNFLESTNVHSPS